MKRVIPFLILQLLISLNIPAQDLAVALNEPTVLMRSLQPSNEENYRWEFTWMAPDLHLENENSGEWTHKLGREVASLKEYLNNACVTLEPIAPGNPSTRMVIHKPSIYNAVRSVEKYYLARVRKEETSETDAKNGFTQVLKVAIAAMTEESESFEEALQQNRKEEQQLISLFKQVKLHQY